MSQGSQQQQQQAADMLLNPRQAMNWLYVLACGHATCITVFIRHSFGTEALGRNGIIALLWILLYACATEEPRMLTYFWVWLAALVVQRIKTFRLWRSGLIWHSHYAGYPYLALKIPFVKAEGTAKQWEPLFCLIVGAALCPVSEPLGGFVLLGFISLMIVRAIETQGVVNRMRAMQDAAIEQRVMASLFRGESRFSDF